jgi:hypothetical protein
MISDDAKEQLAEKFAAAVAAYDEIPVELLELKYHDGDVEVPGFIAMSARTPERTVRGWVSESGDPLVIPQQTSLIPLLEALGFADDPPPVDDDRLAGILAWAYGDSYKLISHVEKGDLGIRADLWCPPMREVRDDGTTVLRYVLRDLDPEVPSILSMTVERKPDGAYKFRTWTLAPRSKDDDTDDDE